MPTGPKGEKRPADVIGNAVHVISVQGNRHGAGAYRAAAAREAWSSGEIKDKPECSMGASE